MSQALVTATLPVPSVVGSLDAYISAVHRIPVLSQDEEQACRVAISAEDLASARNW
jgi:RNA polymerase sigma-32 factor